FDDLFQGRAALVLGGHVSQEHLRLSRNHRQGRVHFVGDTGGQQADGREFLRLRQLILQADTLRQVGEDQQSPQHAPVLAHEWCSRDVYNQLPPAGILEVKLVERKGRGGIRGRRQLGEEIGRKNLVE